MNASITWDPHYRNNAHEQTTAILDFTQLQGQPRFYTKVSQLMQTANKLFGNDARYKRKDYETRSERTRQDVYMDAACKFDNRTEKQHPPPHAHTEKAISSSASHDLIISQLEWCWKGSPFRGPKWNKLHSALICYFSWVETGIEKFSDYKLNQKLLRHGIMQQLFTLTTNWVCMLWDVAAGPSPGVFQAEVLQGSCAYLEY